MMTEAILPDDLPLTNHRANARDRRRLTRAALVSGLAHAVLLALLIGLWDPEPEEAPLAPIPVTLSEEGAAGATGGGNDVTAAASSAASASPAAPQAEPAQTQTVEAAPVPPQPEEQAPVIAPPTPAPPVTAAEPPPLPSEIAEPIPPRKPTPPRPPHATAKVQAPPAPVQSATNSPPAPQANPAPNAATAATASATAAAGEGGRGRGDEGAGRAAFGDGPLEGPGDDYLAQVQRWITRFRVYPDEAIKQKQEGTVSLGFKFARDGTILDAWIEKGSGYKLLDEAALKMIHAASPIPKVPDKYEGETLTLAMPERFKIGVFDRLFH